MLCERGFSAHGTLEDRYHETNRIGRMEIKLTDLILSSPPAGADPLRMKPINQFLRRLPAQKLELVGLIAVGTEVGFSLVQSLARS